MIRRRLPDVSISCDLIVGFPQESDDDFARTVSFLKQCRFSFLHVFPYSPRIGTAAEKMSGQIDAAEKKRRARICLDLSKELNDQYCQSWLYKEAVVIAEQSEGEYTSGYTSQYIPVLIKGRFKHGEAVKVRLTQYKEHQMYAEKEDEL